ncbi:MAG: DUF4168 domain-containing protein [Pseudomonadota bacterium]
MLVEYRYVTVAILGAWALALMPALPAAGAETGAVQLMSADEIGSERLEQFADASVRVEAVQEKWMERMEGTDDPAQVAQMQESMQAEIRDEIEAAGLTVEDYDAIYTLVEANDEVATEVMRLQ